MKYMRCFLLPIFCLFTLLPQYALAQVEINMEALDDVRRPSAAAPAPLAYPLKPPQKEEQSAPPPVEATQPMPTDDPVIAQDLNPGLPETESVLPEKPARPRMAAQKPPPLPPKRPSVAHASREFIETVRSQKKEPEHIIVTEPAPAIKRATRTPQKKKQTNPEIIDITERDPLGQQLVDPSAIDILEQLDPEEAQRARNFESSTRDIPPPPPFVIRYDGPDGTEIPASVITQIQEQVLPVLKDDTQLRVEIRAFASSINGDEIQARRTSLARALAIRTYLTQNDIDPTRIDIRPLGAQAEAPAPDSASIIMNNGGI